MGFRSGPPCAASRGPFAAPEKEVFVRSERLFAVCFDYPYQKNDDVTISLPAGWTVSSVPQPQDRDAKAAEYTLKVEDKKTEVHISRSVRNDIFLVPQPKYLALRAFCQSVRSGDEQQIVLQPSAVAAAH